MGFLGKQWRLQRFHSPTPRRTRLRVETLESRVVPYAVTGNSWPVPQLITISFVPDGTIVGSSNNGYVYSNLFSVFNAKFGSPSVWENAILKGAQLWAQQTNINFAIVSDSGASEGAGNYEQGDPTMGDIRISGYGFTTGALAVAAQPPPVNNYSIAGDISFNTGQTWYTNGATYDLQTVATHEFGHALGLDHSRVTAAVMYANYTGKKWALNSDDVQGVQAIYGGTRANDVYDLGLGNNSFATASLLTPLIDPVLQTAVVTGLNIASTSDVDYYTFSVISANTTSVTVNVQSQGLSLLAPTLTVYASDQSTVLGSASGAGQYGTTLSVTVSNVTLGQVFYVKVAGADSTQFGTGAYALTLNLGGGTNPTVPLPNTQTLDGYPQSSGGSNPEEPGVGTVSDRQADTFPDADAGTQGSVAAAPAPASQPVRELSSAPSQAAVSSGSEILSAAARVMAGPLSSANFLLTPAMQPSTAVIVATVNSPASAGTPPGPQGADVNLSGGGGGDVGPRPVEASVEGKASDLDREVAPSATTSSGTLPTSTAPEAAAAAVSWDRATDAYFAERNLNVAAPSATGTVAVPEGVASQASTPAAAIAGLAAVLVGSDTIRREQPEERKCRAK